MFCSHCFTERCISIPRLGFHKLDLQLALPSSLFFSPYQRRRSSLLYRSRSLAIPSQPRNQGEPSKERTVKQKQADDATERKSSHFRLRRADPRSQTQSHSHSHSDSSAFNKTAPRHFSQDATRIAPSSKTHSSSRFFSAAVTTPSRGKVSGTLNLPAPAPQMTSHKRPTTSQLEDGGAGGRKRKKKFSPDSLFRRNLDMCSKYGDVLYALELYDAAVQEGTPRLDQYAYNVILYLCASAALGTLKPGKSGNDKLRAADKDDHHANRAAGQDPVELDPEAQSSEPKHRWKLTELTDDVKKTAQEKGFQVYKHMHASGVTAGEATLTSVARLALAVDDGDLAFEVIKEMAARNIAPKLRSYGPALFTYCKLGQVEKAFEVYAHMNKTGVHPEEDELRALLQLSVNAALDDKVYILLQRLRTSLRQLSPATVELIAQWFNSDAAAQAGRHIWDSLPSPCQIKKAVEAGGGGWHGLGWLGRGPWKAEYTTLTKTGRCRCCHEQLVTIDIDPKETEAFAESLATLACSREVHADFKNFQAWLDRHGPYDAIVDAANVGLLNQNFSEGGFNFVQVNAVVQGIQKLGPSNKTPLIVLHHKRTKGGAAATQTGQQCLQAWRRADTIFTTPTGSNDDWYWLYAAVKYKCLLVTNDEMRDHLFQLLGNDFFPKWKERHQVRFTISKRDDVEFHMPPPYSIVVQESEMGNFHFPVSGGDDISSPLEWLCVTRPGTLDTQRPLASSVEGTVVVDKTQGPPMPDRSEAVPVQGRELLPALTSNEVPNVSSSSAHPLHQQQKRHHGKEQLKLKPHGSPKSAHERVKDSKQRGSPGSPKSLKDSSTGVEESVWSGMAKVFKAGSSPRVKSKKSPRSPTCKQLEDAEKMSGSPVDFQI